MTVSRIAPSNRMLYVLIAGLIVISIAVQLVRDRGWQPYVPASGVMWIRSGPLAKRLALGFDNLAADVYWIRAVVYFGGQRRNERQRNFDQLYPLLDLVTSLDPYFRVAYRFGAVFLAERFPGGAGRPDQAVQLLQKGLAVDSSRWEYAEDIGFVYYWWLSDYTQAAEWFKRAGEMPNAPNWLAPLAAVTLAEGGNRDSSRKLWTELRDNTDVDWIKRNANHRLQQLEAMDIIDELNRITARFAERTGRPPANWAEVARLERWRGIPTDSSGTPFTLDPASGRVGLNERSSLWPLPVGPAADTRP
jgi:tetratricopeptide (TPR) repeat protein